jgi:polygalacturonase
MTYNPGVEFNTYVFVDGVYQNKSTYSISGTNVIFSEAPPLNSKIELNVFRALTLSETTQASNVGYTATGASALRTVQTKLDEFVSVKDFGAVGDGVTDDTAAFNAAWAATDPQAVYVPAASYAITGTVTGKFFSFGVATVVGGTVTTINNLVP